MAEHRELRHAYAAPNKGYTGAHQGTRDCHTSGVPGPGDLGENTWSSIYKGRARFLVKHLRAKL